MRGKHLELPSSSQAREDKLSKFINLYTQPSTQKNYNRILRQFFHTIYVEEWKPLLAKVENRYEKAELEYNLATEYANKYFQEKRNYEADVIKHCKKKMNIAPISYRIVVSVIKNFLEENNVEFKPRFWKRIRGMKKGSKAISRDRVPTPKQLRRLMQHLPIHGKALFLTLASSGMRIGEALQIKLNDIYLEEDPVRIDVRAEYTKTGNRRDTFISDEAKEAILDWIPLREEYLKTAVLKSTLIEKDPEDDRIFPFTETVAYSLWKSALDKTSLNGRDKTTNRHFFHVHTLRKFFRTYHRADRDVREVIMGHEGYLTEAYRRYQDNPKLLAEEYKKGVFGVHIFSDIGTIDALKRGVDKKNEILNEMLQSLTVENSRLKNMIETTTIDFQKFVESTKKEIKSAQEDFMALKQHYDELEASYDEVISLNEEMRLYIEQAKPIIEKLKSIPGLLEKLA